eukprot:tig00001428_g8720.t1
MLCDGLEYGRSSNVLDLRFVPDGQDFSERKMRDVATEVPPKYAPPTFETKALQSTRVECTWEAGDEDANRTRLTSDKVFRKQKDVRYRDYNALLASSDEEEEEEEAGGEGSGGEWDAASSRASSKKSTLSKAERRAKRREMRDKYTALLFGDGDKAKKNPGDMEATFVPGAAARGRELAEKLQNKGGEEEKTVWEKYLEERKRRRKERRKARQAGDSSGAEASGADEDEGDGEGEGAGPSGKGEMKADVFGGADLGFNDPFFLGAGARPPKPSKAAAREKQRAEAAEERAREKEEARREEEKRRAELELLMMDESLPAEGAERKRGFNTKEDKKKKKDKAKKKGGRGAEEAAGEEEAAGFKIDTADPRFAALFSSPAFAIDPTHPQFKKTAVTLQIQAERQKRRAAPAEPAPAPERPAPSSAAGGAGREEDGADRRPLSAIVSALKRKAAAAAEPAPRPAPAPVKAPPPKKPKAK